MSNNEFDYMPIRRRLDKLKQDSGMDAYEFCKIYAPERCKGSKDTARNYIAAVFSGSTSINNKPVIPDIEHLLNIVNSDQFPNVTLNYLVYGDEEPAKTIEKVDLNLESWTLSDFCAFVGNLVDKYPEIVLDRGVSEEFPVEIHPGDEVLEKQYYSVIKIPEYDTVSDQGFDLGMGLSLFIEKFKEMQNISSEKAKSAMYEQLIKAINEDKRYCKQPLSLCGEEDHFIRFDGENGDVVDGLEID